MQRTVICQGKGVHHYQGNVRRNAHFSEKQREQEAAGVTSQEPQVAMPDPIHVHLDDLTEEEFNAFEPGQSYTLTIG